MILLIDRKKYTPKQFTDLVKQTLESKLEEVLDLKTSNMEILLGQGNQEQNTQKVLEYFKNSSNWEDYTQHWIDECKSSPEPQEGEIAPKRVISCVRAEQNHFKNKGGLVAVSVTNNSPSKFGKEGEYAVDISFYDVEDDPQNKSAEKIGVIAKTFCELMKFAEDNNMQFVVKHSERVYTGERGYIVHWKPSQKE